jgi:hypothetical protein
MEIYGQFFTVQIERDILLVNFPWIPMTHEISVQRLLSQKYGDISTILFTPQDQTEKFRKEYSATSWLQMLSK